MSDTSFLTPIPFVLCYVANMSEPDYQDERKDLPFSTHTCMLTIQCNAAVWGLYYSARASYGPLVASLNPAFDPSPASSPLDASFWHSLTEVFATNDTAFGLYRNRTVRDAPPPIGGRNCSETCRNVTICDMRAMRAEDSCVSSVSSFFEISPFVFLFSFHHCTCGCCCAMRCTKAVNSHSIFLVPTELKGHRFPKQARSKPGEVQFPGARDP